MRRTIVRLSVLALALLLTASLFAGCAAPGEGAGSAAETNPPPVDPNRKIALITDYGGIDDMGYNQAVYEAAKAWCEEYKAAFSWYKPDGDSTADRAAKIEEAAADGCSVLLLPGYAFAGAIAETVEHYPDVKFVALDVSEYDLQDAKGTSEDFSWKYPANLYASVYRAEQAGYLAGCAAVRLGYTRLGFMGGMAVPEVVRYGYGFVQGVNDAAAELGKQSEIELKYIYDNTLCPGDFLGEASKWYEAGTELILACGGYVWMEVAEAAQNTGGRLIGVDADMAPRIEAKYGAGLTVTSAVKNLGGTVRTQLSRIAAGSFEGGRVELLGVVSEDPEENFVQLAASTRWNEGFTEEDYRTLAAELFSGKRSVSDDVENYPTVEIRVDYLGNIK